MLSMLGPRPVIFYDAKVDTYLCFWQGFIMTHKQALVIASFFYLNIYPTPKVKNEIFAEFKKLQYSADLGGAICDPLNWNPDGHFNYMVKFLEVNAKKMTVSPKEVIKWFNTTGLKEKYDQ